MSWTLCICWSWMSCAFVAPNSTLFWESMHDVIHWQSDCWHSCNRWNSNLPWCIMHQGGSCLQRVSDMLTSFEQLKVTCCIWILRQLYQEMKQHNIWKGQCCTIHPSQFPTFVVLTLLWLHDEHRAQWQLILFICGVVSTLRLKGSLCPCSNWRPSHKCGEE